MDARPDRATRSYLPRLLTIGRACCALGLTATLTACGPADRAKKLPPRAEKAVVVKAGSGPGPALLPACPGTGHWEPCTVFDRLERAGLAPQKGDSLRLPFLTVEGQTWRLGAATIHVFRYRDSLARHGDFAALDSLHARPTGDTLTSWPGTPTVLVNDNLLAILLSENEEQVERVTLALTAGPPPKAPAAPK